MDDQMNEQETKIYEIEGNEGKVYRCILSYGKDNVSFDVSCEGDIFDESYSLSLDFKDLQKKAKGFRVCDNCPETFYLMAELFDNKNVSIKKENSSLKIIIIVPYTPKNKEEIQLLLNKQEGINYLIRTDKKLKNKNEEIKKTLNLLEKKRRTSKIEKEEREKIENEEKEKEEREKIENEEKEKEENEQNKSKIMTTNKQISFIKDKFSKRGEIIQELNLLFSSSNHGDSIKTVHKKIDGKENILLLIETTEGRKFGGYTKIGFDSSTGTKKDDDAFVFSFDESLIYDNNNGNYAIACHEEDTPLIFLNDGKNIISIPNNFLSKNGCTMGFNGLNGEKTFLVKKLEYFQIVFHEFKNKK